MNQPQRIQAVIFDFDGVIADTEPLHHQSFCAVVRNDGLDCSWEEYVREYIGFDDRDLFRAAYRKLGRELSADELAERVNAKAQAFIELTQGGVDAYDGIPAVVHAAEAVAVVGLCSGALRSDIDPILRQLHLTDTFRTMVTAEDVPASKPDPACYRLAVQRLSETTGQTLEPAACVAIEDTPAGIESAKGAGLQVWAVTHTHEAADVAGADHVFDGHPAIIEHLRHLYAH